MRIDHAALKWLLNRRNRLPGGYDFDIEHQAGTSHRNQDALSRRSGPAE